LSASPLKLADLMQPHPMLRLPESDAEWSRLIASIGGKDALRGWLEKRYLRIQQAKSDPLRNGFESAEVPQADGSVAEYLPAWAETRRQMAAGYTDLLLLGGNRASKTQHAAKLAIERSLAKDNATVWGWIMDENSSIDRMQKVVAEFLPPELRSIKKQGHVKISYSLATGFSERIMVLPNRSRFRFFTYKQWQQDPICAEGDETDFIWCDELVPARLLETLRFRNVTRGGQLITTFTPLEGYTEAVSQYLEGARIVSTRRARFVPRDEIWVRGCPPGHMPFVLESAAVGRRVVVYFTEDNPFNPLANVVKLLAGQTRGTVMLRAYGWPTKLSETKFPKFSDTNVVRESDIPKEGTNYMILDPAGSRNWFMLWVRVDPLGRVFVYREWPDVASCGAWTEPGEKADGKRGPAQTIENGKGVIEYKRLILTAEGWFWDETAGEWKQRPGVAERILQRLADPRGGSAQVPGIDEGTSVLDLLNDEQVDRRGRVVGPRMDVVPAIAHFVEDGVQLLNDWLAWDENKPLSEMNRPNLFISEKCQNLIYAMRTWTNVDGDKGASKDPIDCIRYIAKWGATYVEERRMTGGRKWGGY